MTLRVVNVTAASATAATSPAVLPDWRNTAQADMSRHVPVMSTDTRPIPNAAPNSRTGAAIR